MKNVMKEAPLVSIIMPVYNAEKTLKDAVNSVLEQAYQKWELVIIDDGSSDGSYRMIRDFSDIDSRIISMRNEKNTGVSETRNKGIASAKGDWIAFLDSDDRWLPDKLEKQIKVIYKKTDASLIYTGSSFLDNEGRKSEYLLKVPETVSYGELLKQNIISCSSVLIKKELMKKYPMKLDKLHEDYAVWLQVLRDGHRAYGIDEPLLEYRLSGKSKSGDKRKAAIMTYRVYQYIGLNKMQSFYYFLFYTCRNLKKYYDIRHNIMKRKV